MKDKSGINWDAIPSLLRKNRKTYASATCFICGKTISEGAYSGRDGNLKKHMAAHERKGKE